LAARVTLTLTKFRYRVIGNDFYHGLDHDCDKTILQQNHKNEEINFEFVDAKIDAVSKIEDIFTYSAAVNY
jgi:hypothetical protein